MAKATKSPCWTGYQQEGTKKSKVHADKQVPNCVKIKPKKTKKNV